MPKRPSSTTLRLSYPTSYEGSKESDNKIDDAMSTQASNTMYLDREDAPNEGRTSSSYRMSSQGWNQLTWILKMGLNLHSGAMCV